jgi:hypothetical protein
MPRFHFHLRAHGRIHRDRDGTEMPDLAAAFLHAEAVAGEMMRHAVGGERHWSIRVEDAAGQPRFDLFFADIDSSLDAFSPQMRLVVIDTCRRLGALTDVLCAAHATMVESRVLLARARGRPQLVYAKGE